MNDTPEDLERRRLQQRLVELRNQLAEISGGEHMFGPAGEGLGLEQEIAFLEHIIAFETAPQTTWLQVLSESGYDMPDPARMSDAEIGLEVWQVIQRLSERRVYLYNTNHLSDRKLYEYLYQDGLRQETQQMPDDPDSACHLDVIGSGSEEDVTIYLRYYADEEERKRWQDEFPDFELPPREKAPFERDHLLPERTHEPDLLDQYLHRLANIEWDESDNPIHLSPGLTHDELANVPIYKTARVLLEAVQEEGRVKATAKLGDLCRAFVKEIYPHLPIRTEVRELHESFSKVINEADLHILFKTRIAAEDSGLLRSQKGYFLLTRKGESLLDPASAGELYLALFLALFRKVDLGFFDHYAELPYLQGTLAISLWRLGIVAREWMDPQQLLTETLVPAAADQLEAHRRAHLPPERILHTRLWRHLIDFGLLESDRPDDGQKRYRITALFSRFVTFEPPHPVVG